MEDVETLLQPYVGYLSLGMYDDANEALESLPTEIKTHRLVLWARLDLLVEMRKWEEGVLLGESLCKLWPDQREFVIRTAYCLHELKRTAEAKDMLLNAPASHRESAVFNYNLACYETQLGNIDEAKKLLVSCFQKDKDFRGQALDDPDLEPLWESIGAL